MPISLSYPEDETVNKSLKILVSRSISFAHSARSILRSVSFRGRDAGNDSNHKSLGSRQLMIKGSLSFNNAGQKQPFHFETTVSVVSPHDDEKDRQKGSDESCRFLRPAALPNEPPQSPLAGVGSPKHEAAVKLQKVYRSFRTRRQLADCAILVEQQWWRLIDFALLKRSSVSFFNLQKQETAVSRWSRARTRAAKVGKGLSKDEKAQKLALQHWLEAIDPRHRYGHNLHFYYDHWLKCESKQPFFYWLDVGEGKEINLQEKCSRQKLQHQCIMYLGPREREAYQVIVEEGKFIYKNSGEILHTCDGSKDEKWIFVLSTSKILYVGQKKKGKFQHSSFLAGGATSAAGRLVTETGILKAVWPHSGHYRPTNANFQEFMSFLQGNGVDLTDVRKIPVEGEEDTCGGLISSTSELELCAGGKLCAGGNNVAEKQLTHASATKLNGDELPKALKPVKLSQSEEKLVHEEMDNIMDESKSSNPNEVVNFVLEDSSISEQMFSPRKRNFFKEDQDEEEESSLPSELIHRRIKSKKGVESYQLGKKLTFKWADGMGPRIACVRDYPSELQFRALEQVCLSPRSPSKLPLVSPGIEGCRKLSNLSS